MKKPLTKALLMAIAALITFSCEREHNGNEDDLNLTPGQKAVSQLLNDVGALSVKEEKLDTTQIDPVEKTNEGYTSPYTKRHYGGTTIKTTRKVSIIDNPDEFATLNPWSGIYPGALIQGGTLKDGIPATLPLSTKRKPGTIYLYSVTGSEKTYMKENVTMSEAHVNEAMNKLLYLHLSETLDSRISFSMQKVESLEELAVSTGINFNINKVELATKFGSELSKNKSYIAVRLNQIYFTMAYDPMSFTEVFTDDIKPADFGGAIKAGNPLCYVSSISYGRVFILLYETSRSAKDLQFALESAYGNCVDMSSMHRAKEILAETTCKLKMLGGNPKEGLEAAFGDFDMIENFVINGAVQSGESIGAPVSYKINHLFNHSIVRLSNTLEYNVTEQTFLPEDSEGPSEVVIDILGIESGTPTVQGKYKPVKDEVYVKIDQVYRGKYKTGQTPRFGPIEFTNNKATYYHEHSNSGVNAPLFHSIVEPAYYKEDNIEFVIGFRGSMKHRVKNQNGVWDNFDVRHILRFNKEKNLWTVVGNQDNDHSNYSYVPRTFNAGYMTTNLKMKYRLQVNGRVYDLTALSSSSGESK